MLDLTAKLASTSNVEMVQLVIASDASPSGTVSGGRILQWVDLAGSMAATRHARAPVVTAAVDPVSFAAPIRVGHLAFLRARVTAVFGSSMEVQVEVLSEDPVSGERRACCETFLTFVALGADGKPTKAPILLPQTEGEEQRARDAAQRRAERVARRARR